MGYGVLVLVELVVTRILLGIIVVVQEMGVLASVITSKSILAIVVILELVVIVEDVIAPEFEIVSFKLRAAVRELTWSVEWPTKTTAFSVTVTDNRPRARMSHLY